VKVLVTSDWQADYENLDLCKQAAEEILQLQSKYGFKVIVLAGDLKHAYNPVDVRVVNFWLRTIGKWENAGLLVGIDLGNHDRVGMHVDKQNWLPVLRKGGAAAFDDPGFLEVGGAYRVAFLPFRSNPILLKREAHDLAKRTRPETDVLIFHSDLQSARYNVLSSSQSKDVVSPEDLYPGRYLYCVGGHIHFQQRVAEKVWYVGSPFATDWGEANQRKGYILIDFEKKTLKRIRSTIPGWYDPGWPGFEEAKPESWQGAKIRIKVPCEGVQHVRENLDKARLEAVRKYAGAEIVVVPEFIESSGSAAGKIRLDFPDEKKIRVFVQETLPDELRTHEKAIRKYLVEQLALVGGLQRESGELKFSSIKARNFLSYKELAIRFEPGLCVVAGENRDWKGRSNGAGKSSYLQPIAVAHSGQTFKQQKHDGWMRRGTKKGELCDVRLWFRDAQDRECYLRRARQPKELKLKVGGEVVESGNRPESTQKLIEQVTGYTWETLANAIYIDQASSHLMLTGTESQRKGFLAKLQNLERFERAEKAIRDQKSDFERRYELVCDKLQSISTEEKNLLSTISDAKQILAVNRDVKVIFKRTKAQLLEKKEELRVWESEAETQFAKLEREIGKYDAAEKDLIKKRSTTSERLKVLENRIEKFKKLEGTCPVCEQIIDEKLMKIAIPAIEEAARALRKQLDGYAEMDMKITEAAGKLEEKKEAWQENEELEIKIAKLSSELEKLRFEWEQYQKQQQLIDSLLKKVVACQERGGKLTQQKNKIGKWLKVLKYAQTVFQRNGLPAYLNEQICPELNQSAAEYSELFAQGEIQVRFAVDEEGMTDVRVINAHGGEEVKDQSEGEMKMASLITSFAVRSTAPKTNLLILDEPGDGLDAISARSFARGLKKIVGRFGTILLTTHNPAILSELADAKLVVVRKQNGVSEVVDG